ncbi:MAG: VWA domain-containing protein [Ruminococcaceae bacterium]|nr:VWA domain-containing protein [Oscillospiraceae bacterium]
MRFLNPAGLWLLLGIPILIIIYLIKAQHEERPVSSTFIWKLSERFAKKRLPLRRLRRILLFLLQLIMIILAALMAAKPVIVKGASYDYVVILDGSASMQNADEKGKSRFDKAVSAIEKKAQDLSDGHTMTVILAADTASSLIEGSDSSAEVKLALGKAACTNGGCNTEEAMALAQTACNRSENAKVLFYTDCAYEKAGNITVIDMSEDEWNVSLGSLEVRENGDETVFVGSLISYHEQADVTVGLAIDGKTVDARIVSCEKDVAAEVVFTKNKMKPFDTAEIFIEAKDSLAVDNRYALCRKNHAKYKVLLASESPLYLESALTALGSCEVTVVPSLEDVALEGMDLYIFDGLVPDEYPTDGSVVVFGVEHLPQGLQCGTFYEEHERISINKELESDLYNGLSFYGAVVKEYTGLLGNRDWQPLLYCYSVPVMMSSLRENGVRFTVFSFDLHNSNLPLMADYPILIGNLLEYSIPTMISKTDYVAGDSITISSLPGSGDMYLQYPDETIRTLYTENGKCVLPLDAVGIYTVVMKGAQHSEYTDFFVHIAREEAAPQTGDEINIALSAEPNTEPKMATSGIWFWLALAFLLILLIEWEWYYYEQY